MPGEPTESELERTLGLLKATMIGVVTTWFNEINWKHKTPYRAILVTGALTLAFVVTGDIAVLAKSASVLHLVVYGLLNLSVIAFRESTVTYEPAYLLPLYPYVPLAGAASSFALIYWMNPADVALALVFLFGGVAWYLVYARKRTTDDSALADLRRTLEAEGGKAEAIHQ